MTKQEYNGWTNYETWNLALWLDNDQGSYAHWRALAQEAYGHARADKIFTREESAAHTVAEQLEADVKEHAPEVEGFYADVLNAAISEVNWHEIASNWIEECDKEEMEQEAEAE